MRGTTGAATDEGTELIQRIIAGTTAAMMVSAALLTLPAPAAGALTLGQAVHKRVHENKTPVLVKVRTMSRVQRNKLIGQRMVGKFGWSRSHWRCLNRLWARESGWNHRSHNGGSGAHGIPQALPGHKMASAGADWMTNPETQIRWGLRYIRYRYGSPCSAWGHFGATGWY